MKDPYILEDGTLKNLLGITDYEELKKAEKDIGFIKLTNLKHSIVSGISKKVERLSSQLKSQKEDGER